MPGDIDEINRKYYAAEEKYRNEQKFYAAKAENDRNENRMRKMESAHIKEIQRKNFEASLVSHELKLAARRERKQHALEIKNERLKTLEAELARDKAQAELRVIKEKIRWEALTPHEQKLEKLAIKAAEEEKKRSQLKKLEEKKRRDVADKIRKEKSMYEDYLWNKESIELHDEQNKFVLFGKNFIIAIKSLFKEFVRGLCKGTFAVTISFIVLYIIMFILTLIHVSVFRDMQSNSGILWDVQLFTMPSKGEFGWYIIWIIIGLLYFISTLFFMERDYEGVDFIRRPSELVITDTLQKIIDKEESAK